MEGLQAILIANDQLGLERFQTYCLKLLAGICRRLVLESCMFRREIVCITTPNKQAKRQILEPWKHPWMQAGQSGNGWWDDISRDVVGEIRQQRGGAGAGAGAEGQCRL